MNFTKFFKVGSVLYACKIETNSCRISLGKCDVFCFAKLARAFHYNHLMMCGLWFSKCLFIMVTVKLLRFTVYLFAKPCSLMYRMRTMRCYRSRFKGLLLNSLTYIETICPMLLLSGYAFNFTAKKPAPVTQQDSIDLCSRSYRRL